MSRSAPDRYPLYQVVHLSGAIDLEPVEGRLEVVQPVRVGLLRQDRGAVVGGEGALNRVGVVGEVQHTGVVLLLMGPIEAGQCLHRLHAR